MSGYENWFSGGAGLFSTIDDMTKFMLAVSNKGKHIEKKNDVGHAA